MTDDLTHLEAVRVACRANYEAARDARRTAELTERAAYDAWGNARIDYSRAKGHPLAGQVVQRVTTRRGGYFDKYALHRAKNRTVTETGIVTLCDVVRPTFRNHDPIPGEWFVVSKSGQTAYSLDDRDGKCMWEPVA